MSNFKNMAKILTSKLLALREYSFRSRTAYMFGFSFGARLIAQAGNDLGPSLIGRIDCRLWALLRTHKLCFYFRIPTVCEPAGPGFENSKLNADPKLAAKYSQCIHTAVGGFGTRERICHQNWMMGSCGEAQAAARFWYDFQFFIFCALQLCGSRITVIFNIHVLHCRPFPNGNHGLCPVFYNSAFDHVFAAVMKNETCQQALVDRDAVPIALETARMGYWQNYLNNVSEITFYAKTTRDPPYNEESGQSV